MSPPRPDVRLEPLRLEHLPLVMTWVNDHEVMQYFANRQDNITEEQERVFLQKLLASPTDRAWSIFAGDEYAGQCSLNQIYRPAANARGFIALRRDMQGRGIGRTALALLLQKAWTELDLHKVWLIVRRDNRRGQSLYLSLGFEFEGVLRDEYCVAGTFYDMVRMGALRPR